MYTLQYNEARGCCAHLCRCEARVCVLCVLCVCVCVRARAHLCNVCAGELPVIVPYLLESVIEGCERVVLVCQGCDLLLP